MIPNLRDYQLEALRAIGDAEARGVSRQVMALPTGTGKTVIFAELIRRRGGRALVLVHRDELVNQAVDKLAAVGITAGVIKAERDDVDVQVIVASVQTLSRQRRLARLRADFTTIVVDEAHHAVAETYRRVIDHVA